MHGAADMDERGWLELGEPKLLGFAYKVSEIQSWLSQNEFKPTYCRKWLARIGRISWLGVLARSLAKKKVDSRHFILPNGYVTVFKSFVLVFVNHSIIWLLRRRTFCCVHT
jgi:hypothetical protein